MLEKLKNANKVVGTRRLLRAIEAGEIAAFLAEAVKRETCSLSIITPLKEETT